MKGNYSWFPIRKVLFSHVNIFIHADYFITKLDNISVANCAYTSTDRTIPTSFINIEQSLKVIPILKHKAGLLQSVLCASTTPPNFKWN
jgi:hypothetical protein